MRRLLLCLLVACRPAAPTAAPTEPAPAAPIEPAEAEAPTPAGPDDLSDAIAEIRDKHKVPALAGAVVDVDGVVAIGAAGVRRVDEETAATPADQWHLGSDTKAMTATVFARLVDRGTLRWDMTLGEVFGASGVHKKLRPVTLTQLLRHRAGIVENANAFEALGELDGALPPDEHRRIVAATVLAAKPHHPPGGFLYSNLGYVLVGAVLERVTRTPWETLMRDELFEPLGMTSCGFGPPAQGDSRDQPWGHKKALGVYMPTDVDNPPYYGPAATVHCSLEDWGKFARVHFDGAEHVTAESLAMLHQGVEIGPKKGAMAMGWLVPSASRLTDATLLTHDGSNRHNYVSILVVPEKRIAVMGVTNAGDDRARQAIVELTLGMFAQYVLGGERPAKSSTRA